VPVLPPDQVAERLGDRAVFIISVYNTAALWKQFAALGCKRVISYGLLYAGMFDTFLPYYCLDHPSGIVHAAEDIRCALGLFQDEVSRREFVAQVRARLFLDFDEAPMPVSDERRREEYFPSDLYTARDDEVLVDCGAFDGDTVRKFLERRGDRFSAIHAFEPDPKTYERLTANVSALGSELSRKIRTYAIATAARKGTLTFDASGMVTTAASSDGGTRVECDALDAILARAEDPPTLIKMDLEGGEPDALVGARRLVSQHAPVLVVTLYHRQDHLWRLPLLMRELCSDFRFFLRAHAEACWDVSCYAVPRSRVASS
jgi:FkbM family methyltransferase